MQDLPFTVPYNVIANRIINRGTINVGFVYDE